MKAEEELAKLKELAGKYIKAAQATHKSYGVSQEEWDLCDKLEDELLEAIGREQQFVMNWKNYVTIIVVAACTSMAAYIIFNFLQSLWGQ